MVHLRNVEPPRDSLLRGGSFCVRDLVKDRSSLKTE